MTSKDKLTKIVLTAAGVTVGVFLIAKYHKALASKFSKAKNVILFEKLKLRRNQFDLRIINRSVDCKGAIEIIKSQCKTWNLIGFDCEWVTINNSRRKVALIQLCSPDGFCAIFRVCKFNKIPVELRNILEDTEIIKAGVAASDDSKYLLEDYSIKVNSTFDIRFLALLANHKAEGLASLSKNILNIELNKNWRIRCSDWEVPTLSAEQIDYAAKDAFVAVEIFKQLYNQIRPGMNDPASISKFCENYTDISFKNKLAQMNLSPSENGGRKLLNLSKRQKDLNKVLKRAYLTRSSPLYDNCYLQAPDGELLCTIDKAKASWYIKKNLGVEVPDQVAFTVRLNFEPAGRSVGEVGEYYQTEKENKCVVCGKEKDLIRKNVVPHEYRKFFPNVMKDKTSHDILLLCVHCHQISNISDISIRKMLEDKCDAPIYETPNNHDALQKFKAVKRCVRALLSSKNQIPEKRKIQLRKTIQEAYPDQEINDDFLINLDAEKDPAIEHKTSHGELVVEFFKSNEGLIHLEKLFRQHFLDTMQPQHLPKLWNVNHNANRLEIRAQENRVDIQDLKIAGVDEKIIQSMQPSLVVTTPNETENSQSSDKKLSQQIESNNNLIDDDSMSVSSFHSFYSAAGPASKENDERYLSDSTAMSFYETIRSDNSTVDLTDFKSFENSLHSGSSSSTLDESQDFPEDSDTEIEEVSEK